MKYIPSLFIILFVFTFSSAQNYKTSVDSMLTIVEGLEKKEFAYGITLGLKAYDESKKNNYKEGMLSSLLLVSREQYELGQFEDALKNASEANEIALSTSDDKSTSDALRLKGVCLIRLKRYKQGRKELNNALTFATRLNNPQTKISRIGVLYNDIAFAIDQSEGAIDSVAYYYGKGYREFERMALSKTLKDKMLSLACSNVGSGFLRARKLDSAQFYLDRAIQLANATDHKAVIATTSNDLGSLYYLKKDYNSSISYFKKGISVAEKIENPHVLKALYFGLSKAYKKIDDNISSKEYLSKYFLLSDILSKEGDLDELEEEFLSKEKDFANPERSNRSTFFIIGIIIVGLTLGYFLFSKFSKKEVVEGLVEETVPSSVASLDEKQLQKLSLLASQDDPSFLGLFKELYPDFFTKLIRLNSSLIAGEQKMCALLKLDLSTKQIAQYTNSSVRSIEAKKYRLRRKLSIPSDVDLNIWMMNL